MAFQKMMISIDGEKRRQAEQEAKKLGLSFSAFIRLLLSQYFNDVVFEHRQKHMKAYPSRGKHESTQDL